VNITITICTFRRSHIATTLQSLEAMQRPEGCAVSIVVIDNDDTPSAQESVDDTAAAMSLPVRYVHQPGANISIARNAGLDAATTEWVAFLDDDEVVEPDWLVELVGRQRETGADAVFGPSYARYDDDAPDWIVRGDFHSQVAAPRAGVIETGHTCNALLRWGDAPWRHERFALERGKSGGEDTEFFFRLRQFGAEYAIADTAIVREDVPAARLSVKWLLRRRFRIGQSYSASADSLRQRLGLFGSSSVKAGYCFLRAGLALANPERRTFWLMRGTMHAGICAGCLKLPEKSLYGVQGG